MQWNLFTEVKPTPKKQYLVYIDNPFFTGYNMYVATYMFNEEFKTEYWVGIEMNVHHGKTQPNVTHWAELPTKP